MIAAVARLHRQRRIEGGARLLEMPQIDADQALAEHRLLCARVERERALEALTGLLELHEQQLAMPRLQ